MAGEKILIANDQQPIRWTLSQAARSWGFEPVEVTTIKQALEAIDAHEILVTLLDVQFRDGGKAPPKKRRGKRSSDARPSRKSRETKDRSARS